jgi:hypothetical protein
MAAAATAQGAGDDTGPGEHPLCHARRLSNPKGPNGEPSGPRAAVYLPGHRPPRPVTARDTGHAAAARARQEANGAEARRLRPARRAPPAPDGARDQRLTFTGSLVEKTSSVPSLSTTW